MRAQDRYEDPHVASRRIGPKGDEVSPSSSPVSSLPDPYDPLLVGGQRCRMGLTYKLELLGVLKALPSSNEEHSCIDARVEAGLCIKSFAIPGVGQGWGEAGLD